MLSIENDSGFKTKMLSSKFIGFETIGSKML